MADSRIPQRKKRRWQQQAINPPFPVPIATITGVPVGEKNWHYFTGELEGDHVVVKHSGDIHYLHKMGFFGRGFMSQGAPDFYKRLPNVFIPQEDGVPCPYKVARRRMFLRHYQWRKSHDQQPTNEETTNTGQDDEYDSDIEYEPVYDSDRRQLEIYPPDREDHQKSNKSNVDLDLHQQGQGEGHRDTLAGSHENNTFWRPRTSETTQSNTESERMEIMDQSENIALWDSTEAENQSKTVASWDADGEGDADFWGCEDMDQPQQAGASSTLTSGKQDLLQHSNDLWESENASSCGKKIDNEIVDDSTTNEQDLLTKSAVNDHSLLYRNKLASVSKCKETGKEEMPKPLNSGDTSSNAQDLSTNTGNETVDVKSHDCYITEKGDKKPELGSEQLNNKERKMDITSNGVNVCSDLSLDKNVNETSSDIKQQTSSHSEMSVSIEAQEKFATHEMSTTDKDEASGEATTEHAAVINAESESRETTPTKLHPYCDTEDNDADYLVIDDSDTEREKGFRPVKQPDEVWKSILKRDPFPIQEPLILSLEEAFFLSYGLGCLTVVDSKKVPLTLFDLWQRCCKVKAKFLPHYVAYHYFRSKGWVPKPGLLFGADFILYRIGPPFFHGSYSVIVRTVHEGSFTEVEEYTDRKLTWTTFCGLHRVTEHVAKVLMLCYVIVPDSLTEEDRKSPECLSKFKVKLQVINRWISSQERGKEPEQIP